MRGFKSWLLAGSAIACAGVAAAQPVNPPPSSLYGLNGSWTASQTFQGGATIGGPTAAGTALGIGSAQGTSASTNFYRYATGTNAALLRYSLQMTAGAEAVAGNAINSGSNLTLFAYPDTGAGPKTVFRAQRTSGFLGEGLPYFAQFAPIAQIDTKSGPYGTPYGNEINYANGDKNVTMTLGANPITTQDSTVFVTFQMPGCCGPSSGGTPAGPMYIGGGEDVWVLITGATPVNGIDMNTAGLDAFGNQGGGWYYVHANPSVNSFRVNAFTTSGSGPFTGGGSAVQARASMARPQFREISYITSGAAGYNNRANIYWDIAPDHYSPRSMLVGGGPIYQMNFQSIASPPDKSRANSWTAHWIEVDVHNRGADGGYFTDLYGGYNTVMGLYLSAWGDTQGRKGGGTDTNVTAAFIAARYRPVISANSKWVGYYMGFNVTSDALVGEGFDSYYWPPDTDPKVPANHVGGHGGVGADFLGAYARLAGFYTTHAGTSAITVYSNAGQGVWVDLNPGDIINLPQSHSYDGVTFLAGEYAISNIDLVNETVDIQGTGVALIGGTFGGGLNFGEVAYIKRHTPFAWGQAWGGWQHLLFVNQQAHIRDGLAVHSIPKTSYNPGGGLGWDDGLGNIARIDGILNGTGNIDIKLTPIGAAGRLLANKFPTSCSGLASGTLYNNANVAAFCP